MSYFRRLRNTDYIEDNTLTADQEDSWQVDEFELKHLNESERKFIQTECNK